MEVTTLSPEAMHGLEGKHINRVLNIPSRNLLVLSFLRDNQIRVYSDVSCGKLIHVFESHVSPGIQLVFADLFHLFEDVLCSMYPGGNITTWLASSGKVLETFNVVGSIGMRKLNDRRLVVYTSSNKMLLLEHTKGRSIKKLREFSRSDSCYIRDVQGNGAVIVSVGGYGIAEIRNYLTRMKLGSIEVREGTNLVRLSEEFIAIATRGDGILSIHENNGSYTRMGSIDFKKYMPKRRNFPPLAYIQDVLFISSSLVIVTCKIGIYFISLPFLTVKACFEFGCNETANASTVLGNGSVYVAGKNGNCATFKAPEIWKNDIKQFADRIYNGVATSSSPMYSKNSSSNGEVGDAVSGSRKRPRNEFDNKGELTWRTEVEKRAKTQKAQIKNMEEELEKQKLKLRKKERDIEKIVIDLESLKESIKTTKEKADISLEAHKEDMKKVQEKSEMEAEAQKELMKKVILDLETQKETVRKMQENLSIKWEPKPEEMGEIKEEPEINDSSLWRLS